MTELSYNVWVYIESLPSSGMHSVFLVKIINLDNSTVLEDQF